MWTTWSPEELSTQEHAPYSMVTGMVGGSMWTLCNMGLLAQPRDSAMARKPTSPLGERMELEESELFAAQYGTLSSQMIINQEESLHLTVSGQIIFAGVCCFLIISFLSVSSSSLNENEDKFYG